MTTYVRKMLIYVRSFPEHQRKILAFIAMIISAAIVFALWFFLFFSSSYSELGLGKIDTDTSFFDRQLKPDTITPVASLMESFRVFARAFVSQEK